MDRPMSPTQRYPLLILASASPRRQELLRLLGIPHRVRPTAVDEVPLPGESPAALVSRLSRAKAHWVAQREAGLILAADTVVVLDGRILGKPRDVAEARAMLLALRDRWHLVYTAITLMEVPHSGQVRATQTEVDIARVHIRPFTSHELAVYLASGDPLDKAGGYAIQHPAFRPVDKVEGCRATVMGLPIRVMISLFQKLGGPVPTHPDKACRLVFGVCCWSAEEPQGDIFEYGGG